MHQCPKCGHPIETDEPENDLADMGHDEGGEVSDDGDVMDEALADLERELEGSAAKRLPEGKGSTVSIEIVAGKPKKTRPGEDA